MRVRWFVLALAVALSASANSRAAKIVIPTNFGQGADAEVREDELDINLITGAVVGRNRGIGGGANPNLAEMATRGNNSVTEGAANSNPNPPPNRLIANHFPTGDRSSVIYL